MLLTTVVAASLLLRNKEAVPQPKSPIPVNIKPNFRLDNSRHSGTDGRKVNVSWRVQLAGVVLVWASVSELYDDHLVQLHFRYDNRGRVSGYAKGKT